MKKSIQKTTLIAGALMVSAISFAQKKNETSAAVEFKNNYLPSYASQDFDKAKKALIAAKGFIDLAAEHIETKESPKTLWLKGEIYSSIVMLGMQTVDTNFVKLVGADGIDVSIASFKKGFTVSDKFDDEIRESAYGKHDMIDRMAGMLYKGKMFKEAAEAYQTEYKFFDAVGETDSTSLFNSSLCFENAKEYAKAAQGYAQLARLGYKPTTTYALASTNYRRNKQNTEAKELITEGRKKFPLDKELLLEMVNFSIDAGDAAGAENALNEAIATDPTNKQLHYTIGTIYIDLKKNEKAEAALLKAIEIDPNYTDALYQLGAHLVSWASDMKTQANALKFGDPNYDKMIKTADETYTRAINPLEKYIAVNPTDIDVLTILYQLNRSIGNTEKAKEYKVKIDGLKNVEPKPPYKNPDSTSRSNNVISYTYNCFNGKFLVFTYTNINNEGWKENKFESNCK